MSVDKFGRNSNMNNMSSGGGGVSVGYITRLFDEKIKSLTTIDNTCIKAGSNHTVSITNPNWSIVILTLKCDNRIRQNCLHQITISRHFQNKLFTTHTHSTQDNKTYFLKVKITNATDTSVTINASEFIGVISLDNARDTLDNMCGILQTIVM
jgi:hypothetical protein